MKENVERPSRLIDISQLPFDRIEESEEGGLKIGALVPNSDLAYDDRVEARYPRRGSFSTSIFDLCTGVGATRIQDSDVARSKQHLPGVLFERHLPGKLPAHEEAIIRGGRDARPERHTFIGAFSKMTRGISANGAPRSVASKRGRSMGRDSCPTMVLQATSCQYANRSRDAHLQSRTAFPWGRSLMPSRPTPNAYQAEFGTTERTMLGAGPPSGAHRKSLTTNSRESVSPKITIIRWLLIAALIAVMLAIALVLLLESPRAAAAGTVAAWIALPQDCKAQRLP